MAALQDGLQLSDGVTLRNRLVATAHGSGAVSGGKPLDKDIEYWARLAQGGVAMAVVGGNAVSERGTIRQANRTALWLPEVVPGLARRADALKTGGAIPILQMVHLGRETLQAETYYHPVAPSGVRSPREPVAPRAMTDPEIDILVDDFILGARHAYEAGFAGVELHAAHGYLLGQFLSPTVNVRGPSHTARERADVVLRIVAGIRAIDEAFVVGVRLSFGDEQDAGLALDTMQETLATLERVVTYVNVTVGMRTTYVRDMSFESPGILPDVAAIRAATRLPLLVSHGFRSVGDMTAALDSGADMIGMARGLIADPDLPLKVLAGDEAKVRPCVECNEDCRLFTPSLLCTVNPDLAPAGETRRPALPLLIRGTPRPVGAVGIIGAGPAGLETALTLARASRQVAVWDREPQIGGALFTATQAPHRGGWKRLLGYYEAGLRGSAIDLRLGESPAAESLSQYETLVVATGSVESLPDGWVDPRVRSTGEILRQGSQSLAHVEHIVIVDDGFGWWPAIGVLELSISSRVPQVTYVTPALSLAGGIPGESRAQLKDRLQYRGLRLEFASRVDVLDGELVLHNLLSATKTALPADLVVITGERRPNVPAFLLDSETVTPNIFVVGDAITPRKVAHAIAEGRELGLRLAEWDNATRRPLADTTIGWSQNP